MENFERKTEYGNIDWEIVSDILKSENFIENSKNQFGAYSPVYDQGIILPEEIVKQNKLEHQQFIEQELMNIKKMYPELNENHLLTAANLCSRHQSDIDAAIDRDICVIAVTEGNDLSQESYKKALNNLKTNLTNYFNKSGTITYDAISYSEERVVPIVVGQLQKHLSDSSNPLLTWGTARLALAELSNIQMQQEQQRQSSISF
mgnify:CR=1 FL=1